MASDRWIVWVSCAFFVALCGLTGCVAPPDPPAAAAVAEAPASYVGRQTCAQCHQDEERLWTGSHHDLAMQEASAATVLGDFRGATLAHFGVTSTFFQRDGRFFVRTDGPDGQLRDHAVAYTFGVFPLQQYLVEMPGGRLQALPLVWDARPAAEGGQRWFHLYPDDPVPAGDPLHWTGPQQGWNYMCAECHSTGVQKNYRPAEDRYETSWTEIDVSCEACHGPGSRHLAWAKKGAPAAEERKGLEVRLGDPGRVTWTVDPQTGSGKRLAPRAATDEVETCGVCHASRAPLREAAVPGQPLLASHRPALLEPGFYHADGQIEGEVYEYGSFLQSRMHREGVTCADCHEPHAATLRRPGNALCGTCHQADRFDTPAHHRHAVGGSGSACVDCHMPAKTYMGVDSRRDHSLRIPRPDLSVKIGTPNACNECHTDRSAQWAAAAVDRWVGPEKPRKPHYGEAIHAGREGLPGAEKLLADLAADAEAPGIARATALWLLRHKPGETTRTAVERALLDPDPLVRLGAVGAAEALEPDERRLRVTPLLRDPLRGVRVEAARVLAAFQGDADLTAALAEYRSSQEVNADRAEAHLNLGWLAIQRSDLAGADAAFRTALARDPRFVPAWLNLADLRRVEGRENEGEQLLRRALEIEPDNAAAHYALGLLLVRTGRLGDAIDEIGQAARLDPREPRYAETHRLAIASLNQPSATERRPQ